MENNRVAEGSGGAVSAPEPLTREQALRAISACDRMQDLFELATPLIGWERERWGGMIRSCARASYFWRLCVFPVSANARVQTGASWGVSGEALEREGLALAKKTASALLGELRSEGPAPGEEGSEKTALDLVFEKISGEVESAKKALLDTREEIASANPIYCCEETFLADFLMGTSALRKLGVDTSEDKVARPEPEFESWERERFHMQAREAGGRASGG